MSYEVFPTTDAMAALTELLLVGVVLGLGIAMSFWMLGYIVWVIIDMFREV